MKQSRNLISAVVITALSLIIAGCRTTAGLVFADKEWHISNYYGQIIDKDTIYRMTFGNILIPKYLTIISSKDSLEKYTNLDRFMADILHSCRLDSAEILFYAPEMETMFVIPKGEIDYWRPSSITSPMNDEHPYTGFYYSDDNEKWLRKPDEMYTYPIRSKRDQLLMVDFYDYGITPVAQITVFQGANKTTEKMNIPISLYKAFSTRKFKKSYNIERWANSIEWRRKNAIDNYRIGQEQLSRKRK